MHLATFFPRLSVAPALAPAPSPSPSRSPCLSLALIPSSAPQFRVVYRCIVFRPFKGEVMDSVVTNVTKVRCKIKVVRVVPCNLD